MPRLMAAAADMVEQVVDVAAAALLAAAVALCATKVGTLSAVAGASAISAFGLALALLRSIKPEQQFAFRNFAPGERDDFDVPLAVYAAAAPELLLLTDQSAAPAAPANVPHELLLTALDRLQVAPAFDLPELVLDEAARVDPRDPAHEFAAPAASADPELLLDDILAQLGPDSRVVRLFDPAAMPTPGELKARIDRHLGQSPADQRPVDASAALHEALDELRRAIR